MSRKLKGVIITLIFISTVSCKVKADPIVEDGQDNRIQIQNNHVQSLQVKKQELEKKIELLDSQIEEFIRKIEDDKKKIQQTEIEIKDSEKQLNKLEQDLEEETALFSKRARTMYMTGKDSYLEALLSAKGISDFASKIAAIKSIMEYDKKIQASLNNKMMEIKNKQDLLNEKNERLLGLKADNEEKLNSLNESKKAQDILLEEIKREEQAEVQAEAQAVAASKINIQVNVEGILKQIQGNSSGIEGMTPERKKVLEIAIKHMGIPYHWGGTSPSTGFDCSGFTQYVYSECGIMLGRTTYEQINNGKHVSRGELKPGDLVLFGYGNSPHHVGIYVGNGCYIHSPRTGDVIRISPLDRSDFLVGVSVM